MSATTGLHQIGLAYDPVQDRLVLRISSTDKSEWRLALTRRFVRLLWKALVGVIEKHPDIRDDLMPKVREAMLAMQHQAAVESADMGKAFAEDNRDLTSNTGPQLVTAARVTPKRQDLTELHFRTASGTDLRFVIDKTRLHAFCHLLVKSAVNAEWNLPMTIGDAAALAPSGARVH
jgi:hypothetical protein